MRHKFNDELNDGRNSLPVQFCSALLALAGRADPELL